MDNVRSSTVPTLSADYFSSTASLLYLELDSSVFKVRAIANCLSSLIMSVFDDVWSADVKSADVRSFDVRSADVRSADVRSTDVKNAAVWSADVWSAAVRSAAVWAAVVTVVPPRPDRGLYKV